MTVTLEIEPDILEAARREAEAQGITEADMLSDALRRGLGRARPLPLPPRKPWNEEEYRATLAEIHKITKNAPVHGPEAFTRDSISDD